MILDGGTVMVLDAEQAIRIIDALASTDYQTQNDKQVEQKKWMLQLNTTDCFSIKRKVEQKKLKL